MFKEFLALIAQERNLFRNQGWIIPFNVNQATIIINNT